ncbi:carbonic anhydrase [Ranunculus cassubicifolius]
MASTFQMGVSSVSKEPFTINNISTCPIKLPKIRSTSSVKRSSALRSEASRDTLSLTQDIKFKKMNVAESDLATDVFDDMKDRFLSFKKLKYMKNLEHYQNLANAQYPKFMVVACGDSRVCPSNILGFQPGDAFMIRNVANLVPPFENGPTEVNAALEFAVNTLEVPNILIVGHSCCGGIRALMSMEDETLIKMQDEGDPSFIRNWVVVGKNARLSTKAAAGNLTFDQQCKHCEKESINRSLVNLLSYPWIKERVSKGNLSIHAGYYDFTNCTFEKWSLDYEGKEGDKYGIKDRQFWS